jgi:hypothetical protein
MFTSPVGGLVGSAGARQPRHPARDRQAFPSGTGGRDVGAEALDRFSQMTQVGAHPASPRHRIHSRGELSRNSPELMLWGAGKQSTSYERTGAALTFLESLIGTVEAPADWAAEHDHYLYGSPRKV